MGRQNRIPKTLEDKLSDIEEHLYLLRYHMSHLNEREAHLKGLVAELRVLVCFSSGTEGLLWRLADKLDVSDKVYVHFLGSLNTQHPLSKGLDLDLLPPLCRGGEGHPQIPPNHWSLKYMLKKGDAIIVLGKQLTHEYLIKVIAQQMGSAHEDEGLEEVLVEMRDIFVTGVQPYIPILAADADLTLEVGSRVLDKAERKLLFVRKGSFPIRRKKMNNQNERTLVFWLKHEHRDWTINSNGYNFGLFEKPGISANAVKHLDRTIELKFSGPFGQLHFRRPIPRCDERGLQVVITWRDSEVKLYLNGKLVDTVP